MPNFNPKNYPLDYCPTVSPYKEVWLSKEDAEKLKLKINQKK